MAKPIRPTPTLRGEDAKRFIREVLEEQRNPSPERVKFIESAKKAKFKIIGQDKEEITL